MMIRFLEECPSDLEYRLVVYEPCRRSAMQISPLARSRIIFFTDGISIVRYGRVLRLLFSARQDFIVSSTWRSALLVFVASFFCRFRYHISFTHRSTVAHWLDGILRRWQVKNSKLCLADSTSSADWVKRCGVHKAVHVLTPLFPPREVFAAKDHPESPLRICYIGRLAPVKNLKTVCRFIDFLAAQASGMVFDVYGPDGGSKKELIEWIDTRSHDRISVSYRGSIPSDQVHKTAAGYDFILSCSHTEGFGMSIAEAMQVGVVPIVGWVGGPKNYCNDRNSVTLKDYSDAELVSAVGRIMNIWKNRDVYLQMSGCAKSTFTPQMFFVKCYLELLKGCQATSESRP